MGIVDYPIHFLTLSGWEVFNEQSIDMHNGWAFFVHGILGTAMWYFLPIVLHGLFAGKRVAE